MAEEEKLAHDLYTAFAARYDVRVFQRIAAAETRHLTVVRTLLDRYDSLAKPAQESLHAALSERELQTVVKIASGKRLSDIAEELMLSPKTVSVYRTRALEKLNLGNNAELTVYAIRNGLV